MGSRVKQLNLSDENYDVHRKAASKVKVSFHEIFDNICKSRMKDFKCLEDLKSFQKSIEILYRKELKRFGIGIRRFVFITGALLVEHSYPTSVITDYSFDYKRSLRCFEQTIETFGSNPKTVMFDGGGCHLKSRKNPFARLGAGYSNES